VSDGCFCFTNFIDCLKIVGKDYENCYNNEYLQKNCLALKCDNCLYKENNNQLIKYIFIFGGIIFFIFSFICYYFCLIAFKNKQSYTFIR